jgi:hypothetical protein
MTQLTEIIRAKMWSKRRETGAEISWNKGTYAPKDPPIKKVNINDVRSSWEGGKHFDKGDIIYGTPEERENVERIKSALRKGKKMPPVIVRRNPEGLGYQVVDGNHRFQAFREMKARHIDVQELPPILARGKRRKRITGKRKKAYESACPIVSTIRRIVSEARDNKY